MAIEDNEISNLGHWVGVLLGGDAMDFGGEDFVWRRVEPAVD